MRTFIAIDFDDAIRDQLGRAQARLQPSCPALKWVRADQVHLTLKFLGEVRDRLLPEIGEALDRLAVGCPPFEIAVESLGAFPPAGSVRVIWAGIRDSEHRLETCQRQCDEYLGRLGFAPENRAFSPHLTLARAKSPMPGREIREAIRREASTRFGVQLVEGVTFYQSTLTPRGPIYQVLSRHSFGGAGSASGG